jgi:hypothetical protein
MIGSAQRLLITIATLIAVLVSSHAQSQYLTGSERASFVAGHFGACVARYGKNKTSAAVKAMIKDYCRCYSNGLADRMSVKDMESDDRAVPIVREVLKACYDEKVEPAKAEALRRFLQKY